LEHLEQSVIKHRQLGNRRSEALQLGNIAAIYLETGRLEDAHTQYRRALEHAREQGHRPFEAMRLAFLATIDASRDRISSLRWRYELRINQSHHHAFPRQSIQGL